MSRIPLHVAVPCLDELGELPGCLDSLVCSTSESAGREGGEATAKRDMGWRKWEDPDVWVCVNQPESWWDDDDRGKREVCRRNADTIEMLNAFQGLRIHVIDRSSRGRGWGRGAGGVGNARREILNAIMKEAGDESLVVSMDADARVGPGYLRQVLETFEECPGAKGMAAPYYHPLSGDDRVDRAILRYEIYMRTYLIGLLKIGSPYAFTALGSVLSFPLKSYKDVRGFPAREAGEDFYLAQKIRKLGPLCLWGAGPVFPSARESIRVPFGTGPAVRRGVRGDHSSHPLFSFQYFEDIEETAGLFEKLFKRDVVTVMDVFFKEKFGKSNPFEVLRKDHRNVKSFVRACHGRLDALRIFQYLRSRRNGQKDLSDEEVAVSWLNGPLQKDLEAWEAICREKDEITGGEREGAGLSGLAQGGWSYEDCALGALSELRDFLYHVESCLRREKQKYIVENQGVVWC